MNKLKTLFFLLIPLLGFVACTKEKPLEDRSLPESIERPLSFQKFGQALRGVAKEYSSDEKFLVNMFEYAHATDRRAMKPLSQEDEVKARALSKTLYDNADILLNSLGFKEKDLNQSSQDEKMLLAMLLYAEYMDRNGSTLRTGAITDNPYINCALSALGITDLTDLVSDGLEEYAKKKGKKALLKAIAKAAGKTMSWVGWGVAAYDFVTCIDDI